MLIGNGIDIVEIERIDRICQRYGDRFLSRLLTPEEVQYWRENGTRLDSLAGFWAAKEAVAKALGTGFRGFSFSDIIILPDAQGAPRVALQRGAALQAQRLGISRVLVSISHSRCYAVAGAIAWGKSC